MSRKRKEILLNNLLDQQKSDDEDGPANDKDKILFQNKEVPIILNNKSSTNANYYSFGKCQYDERLIGAADQWHQIFIPHQQQTNIMNQVIPEMFRIVGDELFVPCGFRTGISVDFFFVNNQGKALKKFFDHDLRISVNGCSVDLMVKFCVSKFIEGQLIPRCKLDQVIADAIQQANPLKLDLSYISSHEKLVDVRLTLSNKGSFDLLCLRLNVARNKLQNVKMLKLSNNEISNLEPMSKLVGFSFHTIDLSFNNISTAEDLRYLKTQNPRELMLHGNPVTKVPMFKQYISRILPSLEKIDGYAVGQRNINLVRVPSPPTHIDNSSEPIKVFDLVNKKAIRSADLTDYVKKEFPKYHKDNFWSKVVVVHKGKVSKSMILQEMNQQFFNRVPFYPCNYEVNKKMDSFLLRQNFMALNTLIQNNLSMEISSLNLKIKFEIYLNHVECAAGQINWRDKINYVVKKRIKDSRLSLDDFADDIDFKDLELSMCTVSSLSFILNSAKMMNPSILTISIQNNKISAMEGLVDLKHFPNLMSLDLRRNCIKSFDEFTQIQKLLELNLDGNPFCVQYNDQPWKYVHDLLEYFPSLERIDGRRIDRNLIPVVYMQNFIVSPALYTLTEGFINLFFQRYDSNYRKSMKILYDNISIFTLTTTELTGSQNIYRDFSRGFDRTNLFISSEAILEVFELLPKTQHNFTNMCIDVSLMTEEGILININGYFKEPGKTLNDDDVIYGFTRTFYLKRMSRKTGTLDNTFSYIVRNDQLHIRTVTQDEARKAFKHNVVTDDEIRNSCKDLLPVKLQEEEANILLMIKMTQLKRTWCERLLKDADWNIKEALKYFMTFTERGFLSVDDFDIK